MNASRPFRTLRSPFNPGPTWAAAGVFSLLLWGNRSAAQVPSSTEAEKPEPNVLLLVDSSGSMEFKTDGTFPKCTPGDNVNSEKSRWIELLEVLTGRFEDYSCWAQSRNDDDFVDEFSLTDSSGKKRPYDYGYVNPYHRPLSHMCAPGPGEPPPYSTPYSWPAGYEKAVPFNFQLLGSSGSYQTDRSTYSGCDDFSQSNGLLDTYGGLVRFGLMTFDARTSGGTGIGTGDSADYESGAEGNWSYYVGSPIQGRPEDCEFPTDQEVGARNASAPPWEGRMVAFGPADDGVSKTRNQWIQNVLLSTRPYGATPIAGQLDDARRFLYNDDSDDPNSGQPFGPRSDLNWQAENCRKTILILLTDGEPNLDLRPYCEGATAATDGCPYERPREIVEALRTAKGRTATDNPPSAHQTVETYVIGFALGNVLPSGVTEEISCDALTSTQCADPANDKADEERSRKIQACCTLNEIAAAGGDDVNGDPRKAYFASNAAELQSIFADILDDVLQVATRTMPVFSSSGGDASSQGYKFFSAFNPRPDPTNEQIWAGVLERRRYQCIDGVAKLQDTSARDGDDFSANLSSGAGPERRFYTVIADEAKASHKTIRPFFTSGTDGLGTVDGTQEVANGADALAGKIPADAMAIAPATCSTTCRDEAVHYLVGIEDSGQPSRCGDDGTCNLLGGIYHSVPTTVPGRPSELLRDESYTRFVAEMADAESEEDRAPRPSVLYTSTVDGFLHAFNLAPFPGTDKEGERAVKAKENNELWAFLPPAVLPFLRQQQQDKSGLLLDGIPIIKDVVATKDNADPPVVKSYERSAGQALAGQGDWRTVLVQGFGSQSAVGSGYFAVDITQPDREKGHQPTFRWQLTQAANGKALFGKGGTPLITTVFMTVGTETREVPVAVLPGGDATETPGGTTPTDADLQMDVEPVGFKKARDGRAYPVEANAARSLTIVRLDTGEVVRSFRANDDTWGTDFKKTVTVVADLSAPITGQPKAYPETTGAVADRIFVGDRDGRLWHVDVSSRDPAAWKMTRMYDTFFDGDADSSQPIVQPPVLSVDDLGQVTIAFATGTEELGTGTNRVVSLTEKLNDAGTEFVAHVNWHQTLDAGYQVSGNMVLFNKALYYAASRAQATSGAKCDFGASEVYGVHYIEDKLTAAGKDADPASGPAPAPGQTPLDPLKPGLLASQPGMVFGVSIEAEPTCTGDLDEVDGNASFGYGDVQMPKSVKPGGYFLSYSASGNNTAEAERGVLEVREQLDTPRLPVTFQSWAAVYE